MAGFLYYCPDHNQPVTLEDCRAWGLGHAFDRAPMSAEITGGPNNGRGYLFADENRLGEYEPAHKPGLQAWRAMPSGCWLGWYTESPATPADLARAPLLDGYDLPMGDGNAWRVPRVRNLDESGEWGCVLPSTHTMDAAGQIGRGETLPRYRGLWEATESVWAAMLSNDGIDEQEAARVAGEVLGANYAVATFELYQLGCFSDDIRPLGVASLACDYPAYSRWREAKKKAPSPSTPTGSTTPAGEPA